MGGSLLAAASAGDCRNVKGPCPALRPGRLRGAFRFRELVPCFGPRPAAFNSLRSCSFSPRRRSISLPACSNCSRKPGSPPRTPSVACAGHHAWSLPLLLIVTRSRPNVQPFPLINYGAGASRGKSGGHNPNVGFHPKLYLHVACPDRKSTRL